MLEVGAGDSPSPRSDILVDFALEARERQGGRIRRDDRPLVLARGEALPFRDKAFDYAVAFHVLEHSEHPEQFLAELQRVASAGYIETPSLWSERVRPFSFHRAEVTAFTDADGPMLVIRKKPAPAGDPLLERAFAEEFNRGAFDDRSERVGSRASIGRIGSALAWLTRRSHPPGRSKLHAPTTSIRARA